MLQQAHSIRNPAMLCPCDDFELAVETVPLCYVLSDNNLVSWWIVYTVVNHHEKVTIILRTTDRYSSFSFFVLIYYYYCGSIIIIVWSLTLFDWRHHIIPSYLYYIFFVLLCWQFLLFSFIMVVCEVSPLPLRLSSWNSYHRGTWARATRKRQYLVKIILFGKIQTSPALLEHCPDSLKNWTKVNTQY